MRRDVAEPRLAGPGHGWGGDYWYRCFIGVLGLITCSWLNPFSVRGEKSLVSVHFIKHHGVSLALGSHQN